MPRALILLGAVAVLPASGASAQLPDFSGTWKLDPIKSDVAPVSRGRGLPDPTKLTLIITQSADRITIVHRGVGPDQTMTYYLDGRESVTPTRNGDVRSLSRWEDGALVTEGHLHAQTETGPAGIAIHEVRTLSNDGTEMTVTSTMDLGKNYTGRDGPVGVIVSRQVFVRQEP